MYFNEGTALSKKALNKGKSGEREAIKLIQPLVDEIYNEHGLEPPRLQRNTLQSDNGGYDIVGLPWLALEVKRQETLAIPQWWRQTIKQSKPWQLPVLMFRQNNKKWRFITMLRAPSQPVTLGDAYSMMAEIGKDEIFNIFSLIMRKNLTEAK